MISSRSIIGDRLKNELNQLYIFNYTDPHAYLRAIFNYKKSQNPNFSERSWARIMGFSGHAQLNFYLHSKRAIAREHVKKLAIGLGLNSGETLYFETLTKLAREKDIKIKRALERKASRLRAKANLFYLETDQFAVVSDWVHMALLEMTNLRDFKADPGWIQKRLGGKTAPEEVRMAIDRLLRLGLLKKNAQTLAKTHHRLTTPKDRASEAVRNHHKQMAKLACDSLDIQDLSVRDFSAATMTIDTARIEKAKALISDFRTRMDLLMAESDGEETYQFNIHFFRLTEPIENPL